MRVVVIGATGNVGTRVLRSLENEDQVESILGLARRLPRLQMRKDGIDQVGTVRGQILCLGFRGGPLLSPKVRRAMTLPNLHPLAELRFFGLHRVLTTFCQTKRAGT
jgi:Semialdehyde dehydrogenase, NAD binding domain